MSAQREHGDDEVQSFAGAPVRVHVDARRVQGARKVWERIRNPGAARVPARRPGERCAAVSGAQRPDAMNLNILHMLEIAARPEGRLFSTPIGQFTLAAARRARAASPRLARSAQGNRELARDTLGHHETAIRAC